MADEQEHDDYEHLIDDAVDGITADEPVIPPAANLLQLRRTLRAFLAQQTAVGDELERLKGSATMQISADSAMVLAGVATNQRHPVDDVEDPTYRSALSKVMGGQLRGFVLEAIEEVVAVRDITERGLAGLHLLDRINKPLPVTWSNLPPAMLGREINAHCFAIFGGSILR